MLIIFDGVGESFQIGQILNFSLSIFREIYFRVVHGPRDVEGTIEVTGSSKVAQDVNASLSVPLLYRYPRPTDRPSKAVQETVSNSGEH